jgi:hypothetical protein
LPLEACLLLPFALLVLAVKAVCVWLLLGERRQEEGSS